MDKTPCVTCETAGTLLTMEGNAFPCYKCHGSGTVSPPEDAVDCVWLTGRACEDYSACEFCADRDDPVGR